MPRSQQTRFVHPIGHKVRKQKQNNKHMSEENTNSPAAPTEVVPAVLDGKAVELERNGLVKQLSRYQIVKGDRKGTVYFAPKVNFTTQEEWEADVKWFGLETVATTLQTFAKRVFQDIFLGAVGEDGVFNLQQFLKEAADFTSSGMKLKEIKDKMEETQAMVAEKLQKATPADFGNPEWQKDITELNSLILGLKAMAESRSRKKNKDAESEAEPAVEVA